MPHEIYEIYTKYTPNDENNPMKIIPLWWFRTRRKHIYDVHKNFGESILTPIVCVVQVVCNVLSNLSVSSVFVLNVCIICFVKIVKILKFGWDSEARFWSLVQILKQNLTTPISQSVSQCIDLIWQHIGKLVWLAKCHVSHLRTFVGIQTTKVDNVRF